MAQIKGKTTVWLSGSYYGPDDLKKDGSKAVGKLSYSDHDMTEQGWTKIGTAQITLDLIDDEQMVANKVVSLNAEIRKIRANSENAITELQAKIQSLLAITNEVKS